jgi:RNA polymerase sigma factor (sigma-70 family)
MDKEKFKKEVLPLSEKMFGLSFRLLNDRELSKDCVQEAFVKIWEKKDRLKEIENINAFVLTTIRNISIDKLRHIKLVSESAKEIPLQMSESNYEFIEGKHLIRKLIQDLPRQQRLIIELRDIEGFSYEEIAVSLDLEVNNIRVNLSIARKKIKDELIKIYNYGLKKA